LVDVAGRIIAVIFGAGLFALALPPFDHAALAWLTLVPLLVAVRGRTARSGLGYGILYGCAFGWTVTGWSVQAVERYFGFGTPLTVLAMSVFYAVVSAPTFGLFGAGAARLLGAHGRAIRQLAVPALWVAGELLRGRLVAQPWGLLGYTQHGHPGLLQIAAVTGVYGVSFVLAFGNVALLEAIAAPPGRQRLRALAIPMALVAAVWTAGAAFAYRGVIGGFAAHPVAIVQTNLAPAYEWTRAHADRQLLSHVQATMRLPKDPSPALIVWPENAITHYLESDTMIAGSLSQLARARHADLLFGAPRYESGRTYNSIRLLRGDGREGSYYDKQHLVLFAESGLGADPPADAETESPRSFSAGTRPGVLQSFVPVGVSICHEIVYPELIGDEVRAGAAMLVNVSNDGWLDAGTGAAGRQHFAMAVLRAVETRRYLVRAATTGISGVIDPYGRVIATIAPNTSGVITTSVAGRATLTPYVRLGDTFAFSCLFAATLALAWRPVRAFWRRHPTPVPATRLAS
jgi:apolipoprotein N-acyltransferase